MRRFAVLVLGLLPAFPVHAQDAGEALLRRIAAAHRDQWFTTLTFVQHTTFPGTSRPAETWYESMVRPGFLRLDVERDGRMVSRTIFRNDSVYATGANGNTVARPQVHDLLVLLHDLHVGDPDAVVRKLRHAGYDLARTTETRWRDRPVTIVGATSARDSAAKQFWVDDAAAMVVRVRERTADGSFRDIQVGKLTQVARGWVEREVQMFSNAKLTLVEDYRDVRTDVEIPASVFDPAGTALPDWVVRARGSGAPSALAARAARVADSLRAAHFEGARGMTLILLEAGAGFTTTWIRPASQP